MKRILAAALVLAALLTMLPATASATPGFPDITDPAVALDVSTLQMLGVIAGDERGYFNPDETLTRAQFCKMAIVVMGLESQEPQYRNRTIFPDVRASHWAIGYINLAVTGEKKIISGFTDGTFQPDTSVTCAQAVTILMRVLGYTDEDAGYLWPEGYMNLAQSAGLLDGVNASANDGMSRAQAAKMFRNLLDVDVKDGAPFVNTLGTLVPDALIIEYDAVMPDGAKGAIRTTAGTYLPKSGISPDAFLGMRGSLVLDANERIVTILPSSGESKVITVDAAGATYIRASDGTRYTIGAQTPVYTPDGATSFDKVYLDLRTGLAVTLYFSPTGTVDAMYANTAPATEALVLTTGASAELLYNYTGVRDYTIYKNGAAAKVSDLLKYDVLTYDPISKRIEASDFRLSGAYENVVPNLETPGTIRMMGAAFDVLTTAHESLSQFRLGDVITVLFTADMQIAGAVARSELFASAVGVVGSWTQGSEVQTPGLSGLVSPGTGKTQIDAFSFTTNYAAETPSGTVTVTLLNGLKLSGDPYFTAYEAQRMDGEFVTVYSDKPGRLSIARLPGPGANSPFNVEERTVDGFDLLPYVKIFDRVGKTGYVMPVSYDDLTQSVIPAEKVLYVGRDKSNRVHTVVLDDATGDLYTYGFLTESWSYGLTEPNPNASPEAEIRLVSVSNGETSIGPIAAGMCDFTVGLGGLARSVLNNAAGIVPLTEIANVPRSAFYTDSEGKVTMIHDGVTYPVASNVQCYNSTAKIWFDTLNSARAYSQTMSVYVDRTPEDGGKVRMVIVR